MDKINRMITTKKVYLTKHETFWHFSSVPFLLIPVVLTIWDILKGRREIIVFLEFNGVYIFIIGAIFFYYWQRKKLRFKQLKVYIAPDIFTESARKTAEELKWTVDEINENYMRAHRKFSFSDASWSWGEMITIIRTDNEILINSICDPNGLFASVTSYGANKKNVNTYIKNLKELTFPNNH